MPAGDIYASAFQNAQTGLLLLEKVTGRVLQANAAFLHLTGNLDAHVVGHSFWEPPLAADASVGAEMHRHLLDGGSIAGAELPFRANDGRWLLLELNGYATEEVIHLEVRDATGREQSRLAERMETLRLLAGRTAAEFHNLHGTLRATGELLLIGAGQGRPVPGELEEIQLASERAATITRQLQAFSGRIELRPRPVDLNNLVDSMLPKLRELFGRGIQIVPDLSLDAPLLMADPVQVRQVILRLANNSRDAMGRTGTFCLQTRNTSTIESGLGSAEAPSGPYGMLALSDSGPGLDDQSWEHLYEPFFSTKRNGANLGLGLAAVYGIVRQSGGRMWTYSQPGKGATFRIYLPLAGAQFPALLPARPRGSATILLIESNDGMRAVMVNLLKKRGYRVLAALHSKEALRISEANGPPDLLVSRPEPELARLLARVQPELRVLYLGGYTDGLVAREHGLPPRSAFLQKPFAPESFLASIVELLDQPL